jgi:hypothetical protein
VTTFYVDLDAMQQLASQLSAIYQSLGGATNELNSFEPAMGSSRVADALGDFGDGWRDGRKTLMSEIDSLMQAIQGSYEDYLYSETQLARASSSAAVTTTAQATAR